MDDSLGFLELHNSGEWTSQGEDWTMISNSSDDVENEEMNGCGIKGVTLLANKNTRKVVFLTTRSTKDANRWDVMPSLHPFRESLQVLDLHNSRYITSLHDSIGDLPHLRRLIVTRCSRLTTLPDSIGNLKNLTEVGDLDEISDQFKY